MITKNKLDKIFGPIGSIAGVTVLVAGVALIFTSWYGLTLIFIGAFVGLTSTSTIIDFGKMRIKLSTNLFGLISIGEWIDIKSDMKIGIKKSNITWRTYSRSNQTLDIAKHDFRIVLYNSAGNELLPLKKCKTLELAKNEIEMLAGKLGLALI